MLRSDDDLEHEVGLLLQVAEFGCLRSLRWWFGRRYDEIGATVMAGDAWTSMSATGVANGSGMAGS